jgi:hypothetical protein
MNDQLENSPVYRPMDPQSGMRAPMNRNRFRYGRMRKLHSNNSTANLHLSDSCWRLLMWIAIRLATTFPWRNQSGVKPPQSRAKHDALIK